jgi:DNA-binding NtrC family response regulator
LVTQGAAFLSLNPASFHSMKPVRRGGSFFRHVLMLLATDGEVTPATVQIALPFSSDSHPYSSAGSGPLADRVQGFERDVILAELKRTNYHITNAAKALGLERSHLYKKAEQLGIDLRTLRQETGGTAGVE